MSVFCYYNAVSDTCLKVLNTYMALQILLVSNQGVEFLNHVLTGHFSVFLKETSIQRFAYLEFLIEV